MTDLPEIHQFLDGFYMSRISIRMLIGQHVALKTQQPGYIGLINIKVRASGQPHVRVRAHVWQL